MEKNYPNAVMTADDRSVILGKYIVQTGATVRVTAKKFGVSKSTVHKYVTSRLFTVNKSLFEQVEKVLQKNKSERHIRGGNATREKYLHHKS